MELYSETYIAIGVAVFVIVLFICAFFRMFIDVMYDYEPV